MYTEKDFFYCQQNSSHNENLVHHSPPPLGTLPRFPVTDRKYTRTGA